MKRRICLISLSKIKQNGRVLRQIDYLREKYDLNVMGYGPKPKKYANNDGIQYFEIQLPKNPLFRNIVRIFARLIQIPFLPKTHPAYKHAVKQNCSVYHAINWDALPVAALAAKKNGASCVVDLQDSYDSWYWGLTAAHIKNILKKYSKEVNASFVAFERLLDQHKDLGYDPIVIRNVPELPKKKVEFHKTNPEKIYLVHHGIATPKRRTDLMIDAIAESDANYELHLIFINHDSSYVKKLQSYAKTVAPGRVHFHPPFLPENIIEGISKYDIGFHLLYPTNRNNYIALPNKLFEFIAAGLAVCIGPSPSMMEVVNHYNCGVIADSFQPEDLAHQLNKTSADEWDRMKKASLKASQELNTEVEMKKLYNLYSRLLMGKNNST